LQLVVMDRLIETKPRAINNYVFDIVTHERDTRLFMEPDFMPLSRTSRMHMADDIALPILSPMDISSGESTRAHPVSISTAQAAATKGFATSARVRGMYCKEQQTASGSAADLISSFRERTLSREKSASDTINMLPCSPGDS
jgi:hypothetical protein